MNRNFIYVLFGKNQPALYSIRQGHHEYHKMKDILHVMKLLGHKNIKNTLIYTQLVTFESDEYHCKTASSVKEAAELIETGYEYVCDLDNVKLFRKRK